MASPTTTKCSTAREGEASDFPVTLVWVGVVALAEIVGDVGGMVLTTISDADVEATGGEEAWGAPVALDSYILSQC